MSFLDKLFSKKGTVYVCYQYSTTGDFGYWVRKNDEEVFCLRSPVVPNPDTYMYGFGKKLLRRSLDREITWVPGVRSIIEDVRGRVDGYYEFVNFSEYRIVTGNAEATVKYLDDSWEIYQGSMRIADIQKINKADRVKFVEEGCDVESRFLINISDEAKTELYPYIMAAPILGF